MNKVLEVEIKNVYGNELIYPVNREAVLIAMLAKSKTLTHDSIRIARELGYTIQTIAMEFNA